MKRKNYDFTTFVSPPSSLRFVANMGDHPHAIRPEEPIDVKEGDVVNATIKVKGEEITRVLACDLLVWDEEASREINHFEGSFDWKDSEHEVVALSDGRVKFGATLYTEETEHVAKAWIDDLRISINDKPVYYCSFGPIHEFLENIATRLKRIKLPTLGLVR